MCHRSAQPTSPGPAPVAQLDGDSQLCPTPAWCCNSRCSAVPAKPRRGCQVLLALPLYLIPPNLVISPHHRSVSSRDQDRRSWEGCGGRAVRAVPPLPGHLQIYQSCSDGLLTEPPRPKVSVSLVRHLLRDCFPHGMTLNNLTQGPALHNRQRTLFQPQGFCDSVWYHFLSRILQITFLEVLKSMSKLSRTKGSCQQGCKHPVLTDLPGVPGSHRPVGPSWDPWQCLCHGALHRHWSFPLVSAQSQRKCLCSALTLL